MSTALTQDDNFASNPRTRSNQDNPCTVPTAISAIEKEVKALKITSQESYLSAISLLARLRGVRKDAEAALKTELAPLKNLIVVKQEQVGIGLTLLRNAESTLQSGILKYKQEAGEQARKKQQREIEKYEARVERAEKKAEDTGKPVAMVALPKIIATPPKTVTTASGSVSTMKVIKWRILDVTQEDLEDGVRRNDPRVKDIPDSFFTLKAGEITKLVKSLGRPGQPLPGCPGVVVFEECTLSVK